MTLYNVIIIYSAQNISHRGKTMENRSDCTDKINLRLYRTTHAVGLTEHRRKLEVRLFTELTNHVLSGKLCHFNFPSKKKKKGRARATPPPRIRSISPWQIKSDPLSKSKKRGEKRGRPISLPRSGQKAPRLLAKVAKIDHRMMHADCDPD